MGSVDFILTEGVGRSAPGKQSLGGAAAGLVGHRVRGLHHLYEAARRQGTKRIVFASSNHVTGCYEQGRPTHPSEPPRPGG